MKKILFLVAFFSIATMTTMNAQTKSAPVLTAAIEAAKTNPDIIQKVGSDGAISFKQKSVCSESGKVSYKAVSYNAETKSWANAPAASSKGAAKSCGSKKGGDACCSSKKAASKSCGTKKAASKSCGSKKAKSCAGKCGSKTTGAKS